MSFNPLSKLIGNSDASRLEKDAPKNRGITSDNHPPGTKFPSWGELLTIGMVNRALAGISQSADHLYVRSRRPIGLPTILSTTNYPTALTAPTTDTISLAETDEFFYFGPTKNDLKLSIRILNADDFTEVLKSDGTPITVIDIEDGATPTSNSLFTGQALDVQAVGGTVDIKEPAGVDHPRHGITLNDGMIAAQVGAGISPVGLRVQILTSTTNGNGPTNDGWYRVVDYKDDFLMLGEFRDRIRLLTKEMDGANTFDLVDHVRRKRTAEEVAATNPAVPLYPWIVVTPVENATQDFMESEYDLPFTAGMEVEFGDQSTGSNPVGEGILRSVSHVDQVAFLNNMINPEATGTAQFHSADFVQKATLKLSDAIPTQGDVVVVIGVKGTMDDIGPESLMMGGTTSSELDITGRVEAYATLDGMYDGSFRTGEARGFGRTIQVDGSGGIEFLGGADSTLSPILKIKGGLFSGATLKVEQDDSTTANAIQIISQGENAIKVDGSMATGLSLSGVYAVAGVYMSGTLTGGSGLKIVSAAKYGIEITSPLSETDARALYVAPTGTWTAAEIIKDNQGAGSGLRVKSSAGAAVVGQHSEVDGVALAIWDSSLAVTASAVVNANAANSDDSSYLEATAFHATYVRSKGHKTAIGANGTRFLDLSTKDKFRFLNSRGGGGATAKEVLSVDVTSDTNTRIFLSTDSGFPSTYGSQEIVANTVDSSTAVIKSGDVGGLLRTLFEGWSTYDTDPNEANNNSVLSFGNDLSTPVAGDTSTLMLKHSDEYLQTSLISEYQSASDGNIRLERKSGSSKTTELIRFELDQGAQKVADFEGRKPVAQVPDIRYGSSDTYDNYDGKEVWYDIDLSRFVVESATGTGWTVEWWDAYNRMYLTIPGTDTGKIVFRIPPMAEGSHSGETGLRSIEKIQIIGEDQGGTATPQLHASVVRSEILYQSGTKTIDKYDSVLGTSTSTLVVSDGFNVEIDVSADTSRFHNFSNLGGESFYLSLETVSSALAGLRIYSIRVCVKTFSIIPSA